MIIKTFLSKIKLSKYTIFLIIICLFTGLIKELISLIILIIFHEFGHFIISYYYKWNINKIMIYPFGGIIIYADQIDKSLKEELLILLGGPLNQLIIYLIFYILYINGYTSDNFYIVLKDYNYNMLIFNLIPVIPLDGSKLVNIILNKIFNYRLSYNLLSFISIIFLFLFIKNNINNTSFIIIISFLLFELFKYIKNKSIMFNRFILEKSLYKNNFKKYIKINSIYKMKRNKNHLIKYNNMFITENKYFKKRSITPKMVYNMDHNNKDKVHSN